MEHPITPPPELVQRLCDKAFLSVMEGASRGDVEVSLILEAYAAGNQLCDARPRHRTGKLMTTTPDFRAELERLVDLYEALGGNWSPHGYTGLWNDALAGARAALATPPPEPPTDEELRKLWLDLYATNDGPTSGEVVTIARAVLDRWGQR
jgi:hypothetical protein